MPGRKMSADRMEYKTKSAMSTRKSTSKVKRNTGATSTTRKSTISLPKSGSRTVSKHVKGGTGIVNRNKQIYKTMIKKK